ncbi:MAG TPA: paraquat-inducible membrane protein A, partial [Succinivibrionaceae bacterium]|nr:paraquat-inducible membrane protein A [Succinivibrionaceae bacterium]
FVASVIIVASLFIPGFKILALSYLSLRVNKGVINNPVILSRLFHIVEFIGKWSMLDVFVVIIMSVAVKFGGLMSVAPGFAILTFCLVVLVTLWAAASFDERLIWDKYVEKK